MRLTHLLRFVLSNDPTQQDVVSARQPQSSSGTDDFEQGSAWNVQLAPGDSAAMPLPATPMSFLYVQVSCPESAPIQPVAGQGVTIAINGGTPFDIFMRGNVLAPNNAPPFPALIDGLLILLGGGITSVEFNNPLSAGQATFTITAAFAG